MNITTLPSPERFGLRAFLDLLPRREPLPGQDGRSFEEFRHQLLHSLMPATAYECLMADNLIALEWELLQHRRMRDRCLLSTMRSKIVDAHISSEKARHEDDLDGEFEAWIDAGNDKESFVEREFDTKPAQRDGEALALRALDPDRSIADPAETEVAALGMEVLSVLAEISASWARSAKYHDDKITELQKRCREVRRDLNALHSIRSIEITEAIG